MQLSEHITIAFLKDYYLHDLKEMLFSRSQFSSLHKIKDELTYSKNVHRNDFKGKCGIYILYIFIPSTHFDLLLLWDPTKCIFLIVVQIWLKYFLQLKLVWNQKWVISVHFSR